MRVVSAFLLATLLASSVATAAENSSMSSPLAGTWTLKSAYDLHKDGSKTFGFGPQPRGILIVGPQGEYSLQVFRSDEPTSGVDEHGMRKEFKADELASTHFGHVMLDTQKHTVTFRIDLSYIQRWNGTVQVRPYVMTGDELSYQVPPQPGSDSVAVSVWQRVGTSSAAVSRIMSDQPSTLARVGTDVEKP
jgi:hypothetical protein